MSARPTSSHPVPRRRLARHGRTVLAGAALVAIGAAVGVWLVTRGGNGDTAAPVVQDIPAPAQPGTPIDIDPGSGLAAATAATPTNAVRGFIDAQIAGDLAASAALLSDTDRSTLTTLDDWAIRLEGLPAIRSYEVSSQTDTTVRTSVVLTPRLDETVGFQPSSATITWETVAEGGGYRIALAATDMVPNLPADDGAAEAAAAWVRARQDCSVDRQYEGNLLGDPGIADQLCGLAGDFRVGEISSLAAFVDPATIQSAFGPDATVFARVVSLDGPARLDLVTAPLGDNWLVVGVAGST